MYTAESISKKIENGGLTVTVQFTDGTDMFTQDFYANSGTDPSWLQNSVFNKLLALNSLTDFSNKLILGPISNEFISPQPTAGQQSCADILNLKKIQTLVELGLLTEDDFNTQKKIVMQTFNKASLDSVPVL